MKKLVAGLMALLVMVCVTSASFAANKPSKDPAAVTAAESSNTIMGKIVSIDKAKNAVVIKDQESKSDKTVMVEAKDIGKLKKGELVKVVLAPGSTDKAGSIEAVKPDAGKKTTSKK